MTTSGRVATLNGNEGVPTKRMIRRTLILGAALLAALSGAGAAAPARAASPNGEMREGIMVLRGLIDRRGAAHFFTYPRASAVRPGRLGGPWWPVDPWTGTRLRPGTHRGHYDYEVTSDRHRYRLVGYLDGRTIVLSGGMPRQIRLAYDHRSEEGINLIRQYVEAYGAIHGIYPLPAEVEAGGPVGSEPIRRYWPSNPWDHRDMTQGAGHGSFSYEVAPDRASYTLRLHRALKRDYVLVDAAATGAWQRLLASLLGAYTYAPTVATLSVHPHSGGPPAGGVAPAPAAPARGFGIAEP